MAPQWTVCRADALAKDERTLLYVLSYPMNVAAIPDWRDRLKAEHPWENLLRAGGAVKLSIDEVNITCTGLVPTRDQALAAKDRMVAKYLETEREDFSRILLVPGGWLIRGSSVIRSK